MVDLKTLIKTLKNAPNSIRLSTFIFLVKVFEGLILMGQVFSSFIIISYRSLISLDISEASSARGLT